MHKLKGDSKFTELHREASLWDNWLTLALLVFLSVIWFGTVTANYAIKLKRPTPFDATIYLKARVVESTDTSATVEAELIADDKVCATCRGLFVAVKEGHPAYHRW